MLTKRTGTITGEPCRFVIPTSPHNKSMDLDAPINTRRLRLPEEVRISNIWNFLTISPESLFLIMLTYSYNKAITVSCDDILFVLPFHSTP
ncbi:MAG: hypothetical protein M1375_03460, partial [Candidatus Thermoplasmatota archaeon]|nr:hypothetical protein [Candidatus Thermoplasmatota archaeon]